MQSPSGLWTPRRNAIGPSQASAFGWAHRSRLSRACSGPTTPTRFRDSSFTALRAPFN